MKKLSMRMNKKGYLDKLISFFPIMLVVFVIMGIFIILAGTFSIKAAASGDRGSPAFSTEILTQDDLMSKQLSFSVKDFGVSNVKTKKMSVFDALSLFILYEKNPAKNAFVDFENTIGKMTMADKKCAIIMYDEGDLHTPRAKGPITTKSVGVSAYTSYMTDFAFAINYPELENTKWYVKYYYGGCL
ncbi:hypothetical protein J4229_01840 [Candidatus Pacearchaeota archaeon]|nr:hypothetical protein [Candidatus Pacearchaeota archaeon]